ncbi:MAG: hypothetical protein A3G34_12810 [Candidatus Lindowbacteria bacterium RIFCSPLOWO2_12_FULL_62_27]|nr:MAG: hypothetical protein A3I06_15255 [Candidatus Lindowbacteria bacterium RIFCSPLOWO2_02_FULL_62_12]OGH62475.1 MAG: hypothetical protein A3G34_12810 [Candidatus Lindowbacteria bacterium RIFCSPLOWO2_12_FULL_62_27]
MELKDRSILVTGGAGFIGSHLVDRLIPEKPGKLVVVDNLFLGKRSNLAEAFTKFPQLKLVVESVCDIDRMRQVVGDEKIDVVFDMATIPLPASLERPDWAAEEIYRMMLVFCALCRQGLFKTLIHCSSSEAYGSAVRVPMDEDHPMMVETPYAAAKAAADLLVRSYARTFNIDMAIIRPFNNYGPRQNEGSYAAIIPVVIRRILAGQPPVIFGDGEQTRDFLYVTDTVEGIVSAAKSDRMHGRTVNIASGREVTIHELIRQISRALDYTGEPIREPARPADVRRHLADTRLAQAELGFKPAVPLEEGIRRTVAWYKTALQ